MAVRELIDKLNCEKKLSHDEWVKLIKEYDESDRAYAAEFARGISQEMFGKDIYIRGIVEFSNIWHKAFKRQREQIQAHRRGDLAVL